MNPSPKRSSKSPKTTPSEKGHLSEQLVNLIKAPVQSPESAVENSTLSAPATPTPVESSKLTASTEATTALTDKLQRPRQRPIPVVQTAPKETPTDDVPAGKKARKEKSDDAPASVDKKAPKAELADAPTASVGKKAPKAELADAPASPEKAKTAVTAGDRETETANATPSDEQPTSIYGTPGAIRQHPIPPASEPKQYRAVGLVKGRYTSSEDQFTRGTLTASDGTAIDAVLLGRVMSLVKNHINLEQEHLWVVYPRTRQQDGNLHAQIMGIWEPETLKKPIDSPSQTDDVVTEENQGEDSSNSQETPTAFSPAPINVENGYFSIRGEVIYQSQEEEKYIIVKIRQIPRKDGETMKFFKLKLNGELAEKAVSYFWDFDVQLQGNKLLITKGTNIGPMPAKKKPFNKGGGGGFKGKSKFTPPKRDPNAPRPEPPNRKPAAVAVEAPPKRTEPLAKPVKKPKSTEG
ncbi:hypothetical protein BCD67_25180 [Oscillatoriales cyanobacterium USR001]|nr:hypothetical protein BCD67_25180 [Oscillatoriales cyanobacterium USR001]